MRDKKEMTNQQLESVYSLIESIIELSETKEEALKQHRKSTKGVDKRKAYCGHPEQVTQQA